MAKIYEARIDHDALETIEVAPPQRDGRWFWGAMFSVFVVAGATLGLTLATGSLRNAVEVAQASFAADGTSDATTN